MYFGLRGSEAVNQNLVTPNNVLGFIEMVKDSEFRNQNPLLWRNGNGSTLLHLAANQYSLEDFNRCVEMLESGLGGEFAVLLAARNEYGNIALSSFPTLFVG